MPRAKINNQGDLIDKTGQKVVFADAKICHICWGEGCKFCYNYGFISVWTKPVEEFEESIDRRLNEARARRAAALEQISSKSKKKSIIVNGISEEERKKRDALIRSITVGKSPVYKPPTKREDDWTSGLPFEPKPTAKVRPNPEDDPEVSELLTKISNKVVNPIDADTIEDEDPELKALLGAIPTESTKIAKKADQILDVQFLKPDEDIRPISKKIQTVVQLPKPEQVEENTDPNVPIALVIRVGSALPVSKGGKYTGKYVVRGADGRLNYFSLETDARKFSEGTLWRLSAEKEDALAGREPEKYPLVVNQPLGDPSGPLPTSQQEPGNRKLQLPT